MQTIEEFDKHATKASMKRHKIASVNLMHESPFAVDRQLEDQKYQIEYNKVIF